MVHAEWDAIKGRYRLWEDFMGFVTEINFQVYLYFEKLLKNLKLCRKY
jgi:hypothetical protein